MLDFTINNEAIQGGVPIPLLTNNPNIRGIKAMAKSNVPKSKKTCKEKGCNLPTRRNGYCNRHSGAARTAGIINQKPCSFSGCDRYTFAKGYCARHYNQLSRVGKTFGHPTRTIMSPNEIIVKGDTGFIRLYNAHGRINGVAIIDAEDVEKCRQFKWHKDAYGYVTTGFRKRKDVKLSNLVMDHVPGSDSFIDHKDRNPKNNKKGNLRHATRSENNTNIAAYSSVTGFKGVEMCKSKLRWSAMVVHRGKRYNLG